MNDEIERINNLIEKMYYNKGFSDGVNYAIKMMTGKEEPDCVPDNKETENPSH